jgi:hypothetical protein
VKQWLPLFVVSCLAVLIVAALMWLPGYTVTERQCDGALPRWMLEPQGYGLAGCADVYPSHEAPPDADWTLYCLGYCIGDIPDWKPPR